MRVYVVVWQTPNTIGYEWFLEPMKHTNFLANEITILRARHGEDKFKHGTIVIDTNLEDPEEIQDEVEFQIEQQWKDIFGEDDDFINSYVNHSRLNFGLIISIVCIAILAILFSIQIRG